MLLAVHWSLTFLAGVAAGVVLLAVGTFAAVLYDYCKNGSPLG